MLGGGDLKPESQLLLVEKILKSLNRIFSLFMRRTSLTFGQNGDEVKPHNEWNKTTFWRRTTHTFPVVHRQAERLKEIQTVVILIVILDIHLGRWPLNFCPKLINITKVNMQIFNFWQNSRPLWLLFSLEYKSRDSYSRLIEFSPKFFYSNLDFE